MDSFELSPEYMHFLRPKSLCAMLNTHQPSKRQLSYKLQMQKESLVTTEELPTLFGTWWFLVEIVVSSQEHAGARKEMTGSPGRKASQAGTHGSQRSVPAFTLTSDLRTFSSRHQPLFSISQVLSFQFPPPALSQSKLDLTVKAQLALFLQYFLISLARQCLQCQ